MNKYIFPIIKWKIKPWLKYYILNKSATSYPLSEITTGTSPLTLSNSVRKKFNIFNVGGNTKQQSYTGKNLLNVSENLSITRLKTVSISLPAGTYHLTCGTVSKGGTDDPHIVIGSYHNALVNNSNYTFTISSNVTSISIYSNGYSYDASVGITSTINQLMISEAGGAYEPYVGGQASPNPSYPQEIENVSGEVELKVENKNLFNVNNTLSPSNKGFSFSSYGQNININGAYNGSSSNAVACSFCGDFKSANYLNYITPSEWIILKAGTYTLSSKIVSGSYSEMTPMLRICKKSESQPYSFIIATSINTPASFTLEEDTECSLGIMVGSLTKDISKFNNLILNIQLEQGSTATSYEPHEEQTATLSLPEGMEMCRIGDYKDSFVEQGGKWYKNKQIGKVVLNGTENWQIRTNSNPTKQFYCNTNATNIKVGSQNVKVQLCNYGNYNNAAWNWGTKKDFLLLDNTAQFVIGNEEKSVEEWEAQLAENNLISYYVLKTPALEEITDTTLISDLNNLKDLYSYKGTTHISSSNEPSPVFEVQYYMEEGA